MKRTFSLGRQGWALVFLLAAVAALAAWPTWAADGGKVSVDTPLGPVVGFTAGRVQVFLGLPFAEPPVGELRFAPPKDAKSWTEPREAFRPGPMAWQVPMAMFQASVAPDKAFPGYSEDCLNLNVWAPVGTKAGDKLPVYVFVHGGGYGMGSGSQDLYDGTNLAKEGIVVVTFNYRLGALGYFSSQETLRQYGTTGNWGTLDQIKALEWVRDNIAAFGGDPAKVTVGGESAGSFSVSALILSPKAKGLFRGAIMESGTILALPTFLLTRGKLDLALNLNAIMGSVFQATDDAEGLAKLRAVDPGLLARLTPFGFDFTKPSFFGLAPVKDGSVLPLDPEKALAEGQGQKVKVLMGFNHDEGSLFVPTGSDDQVYLDTVDFILGLDGAKAFWERFPIDKDHSAVERTREALGYAFMSSNMKRFADLHSRFDDVYFYNFNYVTLASGKLGLGASHASELPFVFGLDIPLVTSSKAEKTLSDDMRLRWINFIKNGDPNEGAAAPSKVTWPKYDPASPRIIAFDKTVTAGPLPDTDNLDFVANILYGPLPLKP
ncbi:MAG: carboxylesterase family protein [Deltaproteobacteria bacterium]|jgi:para-nitrobenzyl esterase|nr:carboxylesterase family protein [Deltaproteobacteria bacterium]